MSGKFLLMVVFVNDVNADSDPLERADEIVYMANRFSDERGGPKEQHQLAKSPAPQWLDGWLSPFSDEELGIAIQQARGR